ncbi:hypothetical protein L1987_38346 [Smallanthus sonchifolius]|uniref:Uncharacterized protein n=1 Tax=Smallanthus sonchifolius TaxID=185202 RepID=A0ACB9HIQ3_9ASTR|nr:hypothetical protein L1987_38346 [Smallanthus sonchifolius]
MGTKGMEEAKVVMKRFGDEQSTLLDRFERLSFEVQLHQAILGRSLSEPRPRAPRYQSPPSESEVAQGRRRHYHHRRLGFQKVLKKLFKPIFGDRKGESIPPDQKNFKLMKAFSKSLRVYKTH